MKLHYYFCRVKERPNDVLWNGHGLGVCCFRWGFSMVELLVAISIVAVLAAILIPVLSSVRQRSLSAACQSNLRQMGVALNVYVAEHDGVFIPAAVYRPVDQGIYLYWYEMLEPYMGGSPEDPKNRPAWQLCPAKDIKPMTLETVGYGWNSRNFGHATGGNNDPDPADDPDGVYSRLMQVENPADTIIIGDSKDATTDDQAYQNRYLYESGQLLAERHSGGGNYLFVDGHVEWMRSAELRERLPGVYRKEK